MKKTPKPKRKPSNTKAMVESGNRMSKMESEAMAAMKKDAKNKAVAKKGTQKKPKNTYKCGGKVKRKK